MPVCLRSDKTNIDLQQVLKNGEEVKNEVDEVKNKVQEVQGT
jgi:hypothetical protein